MTWKELIDLIRFSKDAEEINARRNEIAEWLPCVRTMFEYDQNNSYHQYDLWMHAVHTTLGIDSAIEDDMLYLAALLHDVGKPVCRCKGKREDDKNSHYYGHPEKSEQIVREEVIPHVVKCGALLSDEDIKRLLYYVKYHDDRVSLREKHLNRHLKMVDVETFKNLMRLEVADAKAHVIYPIVQERIDICSEWANKRADDFMASGDVGKVIATMALEEMHVDAEFREQLVEVAAGRKLSEELRQEVLAKYVR